LAYPVGSGRRREAGSESEDPVMAQIVKPIGVTETVELDSAWSRRFDPVRAARSLLRDANEGVLSTQSKAVDGFPYGAPVPYLLTVDRRVALRLQVTSQHALNVRANDRVCLTVTGGESTTESATALGRLARVPDDRLEEIEAGYWSRHPRRGCKGRTGHHFFWFAPSRIRYWGENEEAFWIEAEEWFALAPV
jgi:hypothetical protein